jgi:hypothetical protein
MSRSTLAPILITGFAFFLFAGHAKAQTCTLPSGSSVTPAWINVKKDCGAVGNGTTDDTAAFQNAFNALALASPTGGTIYCPPGQYAIFNNISAGTTGGIRFIGDSGPSVNEAASFTRGCSLLAKTNAMTLLSFGGTTGNHLGPVIEYVNFRDETSTGHTATLVSITNTNDWTLRNVALNDAATGLLLQGTGTNGDASWGYIPQLMCFQSNTCIDSERGGFLAIGGRYFPLGTGIIAKFPQARIIGIKMDCNNTGQLGVDLTGHGDQVEASNFEGGCTAYVNVRNGNTGSINNDGGGVIIVGNRFYCQGFAGCQGVQAGTTTGNVAGTVISNNDFQVPTSGFGITLGTNAQNAVVSGNSYQGGGTVNDSSAASTPSARYDQGFSGLSGSGVPTAPCTNGMLYFNRSGALNSTLYVCTAINTWTNVK